MESQTTLKPCEKLRESSVSAVKAFLDATKEERRRRGKYQKYPLELQEQMAAYAVKQGLSQAVKFFKETLGKPVGETTIRNLIKIHSAFTPAMREEIGKFAAFYGVEPAAKSYSDWLKQDIPLNLVRKFKAVYLSKLPGHSKDSLRTSKCNNESLLKNKKYTTKIKDEIGEHACNHSIRETVNHFTEKLQIPIKERTVKRFLKLFLDKCQDRQHIVATCQGTQTQVPRSCVNQETTHANVYNVTVPVTLYQLNPCTLNNNPTCYHSCSSSSVITTQSGGLFNYHTVQGFPSTSIPVPPPPSYPLTLINRPDKCATDANITIPQSQTCLIPQKSVFLTQDKTGNPVLSHLMAGTQPMQQTILSITPEKELVKVNDNKEISSCSLVPQTYHLENSGHLTEQCKESDSSGAELVLKDTKAPFKIEGESRKRGTYTVYSPEIRAEIGKYAADHGIVKACLHFAKLLGHEVPESTARGLREKYLMKKKRCQVTSLGYSPRGRPLRLGKYDELVQHCLKDLVRSGEKVSSYLAITTAKQVVSQHDPSLLEENGGSLKLNTTWAKSILKRIGVHNNS